MLRIRRRKTGRLAVFNERERVATLIRDPRAPVVEVGAGACACLTQILADQGFRILALDRDAAAAAVPVEKPERSSWRGRGGFSSSELSGSWFSKICSDQSRDSRGWLSYTIALSPGPKNRLRPGEHELRQGGNRLAQMHR